MDNLKHINSLTEQAYNLTANKYHDLFHNEMDKKEYDKKLLDSFAAKFNSNSLICDAGSGPSGQISRYLIDKGLKVIGIDISEKCVQLARLNNPDARFECADISNMPFDENSFDGLISYYSIINTPKIYVDKIFNEFCRVLKQQSYLLVAVKAGTAEGYADNLLGIKTKIYSALFTQEEITAYFQEAGFVMEFIEMRDPYDFEISYKRIFAIGKKV